MSESGEASLPIIPVNHDNGIRILNGPIASSEIGRVTESVNNVEVKESTASRNTEEFVEPVKKTRKRKSVRIIEPMVLPEPSTLASLLPPPPPPPPPPVPTTYQSVYGGNANKRRKFLTVYRFFHTSFREYLLDLGFNFDIAYLQKLSEDDLSLMIDELKFAVATKGQAEHSIGNGLMNLIGMWEGKLGLSGLSRMLKEDQGFQEVLEEFALEYCDWTVLGVEQRFSFSLLQKIVVVFYLNRQMKIMEKDPRVQRLREEIARRAREQNHEEPCEENFPPPL